MTDLAIATAVMVGLCALSYGTALVCGLGTCRACGQLCRPWRAQCWPHHPDHPSNNPEGVR